MFVSGSESLGNSVPVYCSGSTSFDVRSWKISCKNFQGLLSIVQLSMFMFVVAVSCDSFYIISKCFMFVNNFFKLFFVAFLNLSNSNSDILSYIFLLVNNFFEVFSKVIFKQNGERGIWTLAPVARPTPLAGAPLQPLEYFSIIWKSSLPICYWRHFVTQKLLYIRSMCLSIAFFINCRYCL